MVNRRRRNLNITSFRRRYTDSHEIGGTLLGASLYRPIEPLPIPSPSVPTPSFDGGEGGKFGGAGASGSWDSASSSDSGGSD